MSAPETGEPTVQHIFDHARRFNGSEGEWTVCGLPMPDQSDEEAMESLPECPECEDLSMPEADRG